MYSNSCIFLLIIATLLCQPATAQQGSSWKEESSVHKKVHDTPLRLITGEESSIQQLAQKKPIILALIFTRCTGICSPFMLNLKQQILLVKEKKDFQLVVVSFDPKDEIEDIQAYAERFNLNNKPNWHFAVASDIFKLNQSLGFDPLWDDVKKQYEHDALLVGINNQGYTTKKLIGLRDSKSFDELIRSINNVFAPTYRLPSSNTLFSCFNYDPKSGKNTPGLGLLFIALPAILSFSLLIGIRLLQRETTVMN